jgi:hypothetical protein
LKGHMALKCSDLRPLETILKKIWSWFTMVELIKKNKKYLKFRRKLFILNYGKDLGNTAPVHIPIVIDNKFEIWHRQ